MTQNRVYVPPGTPWVNPISNFPKLAKNSILTEYLEEREWKFFSESLAWNQILKGEIYSYLVFWSNSWSIRSASLFLVIHFSLKNVFVASPVHDRSAQPILEIYISKNQPFFNWLVNDPFCSAPPILEIFIFMDQHCISTSLSTIYSAPTILENFNVMDQHFISISRSTIRSVPLIHFSYIYYPVHNLLRSAYFI